MKVSSRKPSKHLPTVEMLRFLAGGVANTILSLALYWALLPTLDYGAAYAISFTVGIFSGYAINTFFVFRTHWSWRKLIAFPLLHLINLLAGLTVIFISINALSIDARLAPVFGIATTLPINFILTRWLIKS